MCCGLWMRVVFCFASAKFGSGGLLVPSKKMIPVECETGWCAAFTGNAQWGPYGPYPHKHWQHDDRIFDLIFDMFESHLIVVSDLYGN